MPIILYLKEPRIELYVKGKISDDPESIKEWDEAFAGRVFVTRSYNDKKGLIIPLDKDCNIALGEEVTEKEIDERKAKMKKLKEEQELREKGGKIAPVTLGMPGGVKGRH